MKEELTVLTLRAFGPGLILMPKKFIFGASMNADGLRPLFLLFVIRCEIYIGGVGYKR